jgi:cytidine deaminase
MAPDEQPSLEPPVEPVGRPGESLRDPPGLPESPELPELSEEESRLIAAAREARGHSYAPYSGFAVGAAVLAGGRVFPGANVENASYGLTICAERAAVFAAAGAGERRLDAVAVVTDTPTPTPPCGACRQVLNEFGPDATVLCATVGGAVVRYHLSDLLPAAFGPEALTDRVQ